MNLNSLLNSIGLLIVSFQKLGRFELERFSVEDQSLVIKFSSREAKRTVVIDRYKNYLAFKGSTLKDMKWMSDLDKVKSFKVTKNGEFKVIFKNGRKFKFGYVSEVFEETLERYIGGLFQ